MASLSAIRSMDPYDFEKLVADVWSKKGYNTTVKQRSNDKGVDVEAVHKNYKILIQAKRYSADNKIGGPDVRRYATLYQQDQAANQVIIVTTGSFTSQAKEIAAEQDLTIIDGENFVNILEEYNISPPIKKRVVSGKSNSLNNNRNTVSDNSSDGNKKKFDGHESAETGPDGISYVAAYVSALLISGILALPTAFFIVVLFSLLFSSTIGNNYVVEIWKEAYIASTLLWIWVLYELGIT